MSVPFRINAFAVQRVSDKVFWTIGSADRSTTQYFLDGEQIIDLAFEALADIVLKSPEKVLYWKARLDSLADKLEAKEERIS
jgi:hypothetical protein